MNIKNRMKKMEMRLNSRAEFCACYPQFFETYIQDLGEDAENNKPVLQGEPAPSVCPYCRKRVEKNSITVQLVDATTKDRFPDEWNARKNK